MTNNYIKSKVGVKYFDEYIKYDVVNSAFRLPNNHIKLPAACIEYIRKTHYFFVYNLLVSDIEDITADIEIITDTEGNLISECFIDKIPKCPDNNCWEYFPIVNKDDATLIAKKAAFEEGIRDWRISFYYYKDDFNDYVWEIKNTLTMGDKDKHRGASGKSLLISANDGSIIREYGWGTIY
jgi:hypothetical protein